MRQARASELWASQLEPDHKDLGNSFSWVATGALQLPGYRDDWREEGGVVTDTSLLEYLSVLCL